jgi:hypothetical protein
MTESFQLGVILKMGLASRKKDAGPGDAIAIKSFWVLVSS